MPDFILAVPRARPVDWLVLPAAQPKQRHSLAFLLWVDITKPTEMRMVQHDQGDELQGNGDGPQSMDENTITSNQLISLGDMQGGVHRKYRNSTCPIA